MIEKEYITLVNRERIAMALHNLKEVMPDGVLVPNDFIKLTLITLTRCRIALDEAIHRMAEEKDAFEQQIPAGRESSAGAVHFGMARITEGTMRPPKCHGEPMARWVHTEEEVGHRRFGCRAWTVWRCQECGKELDLYRWPWTWFWLTVRRHDAEDTFIEIAWWLGSVGSLRGWERNEITFTVIPLNVVIDLIIRVWRRCEYRLPNKFEAELERAYRRGLSDGGIDEPSRR